MVLQERIELSTSPLPRECSTTELLQHLKGAAPRSVGLTAIASEPRQGGAKRLTAASALPIWGTTRGLQVFAADACFCQHGPQSLRPCGEVQDQPPYR
jgi:hypothetical protein